METINKRRPTVVVAIIMALLTLARSQNNSNNVVFELTEEQKADTFVGSVAQGSEVQTEVTPAEFQALRYQMLSSDGLRIASHFTINSRTGALYTNAMIDREHVCDPDVVQCRLEFDVTVKLSVAVLKIVHVVVVILDINDNAPVFPNKELVLSISESSPKGSDYSISGAVDRDAQQGNDITYRMEDNPVFGLHEEKLLGVSLLKIMLLQDLDREQQSEYHLRVYAADGNSSSSLTGTLSLVINVTDVNDNTPQFTEQAFNLTVSEDADVGSLVGTILANDLDTGDNGLITFQFSPLTSNKVLQLFYLQPDSGNVTVRSRLEYQSGQTFQAVVVAKDHGSSPKAAQAVLAITVTDAGNTPPKLSLILVDPAYQNSIYVSEDVPVTWFVGTLRHEDNDDGDDGVVDCTSLNPHFSLHELDKNGLAIKVQTSLDRESESEITVVLSCSDRGQPSLSATVNFTVRVTDANDNPPMFSISDHSASVTENIALQHNIVQVTATDQDEGVNSEVTYRLPGNVTDCLTIDRSSGWISLTCPVDREATPRLLVTVHAVDSGKPSLTGSTTVTIFVQDVNDNTPEILRSHYQVRENEAPGTFVSQIVAADGDAGVNSQLTYHMISGADIGFRVSESGVITTDRTFDRESRDFYMITVSVSDTGSPPRSSSATLTIIITDTNDHTPQFVYPLPGNDSVTVSAMLPPGTVVARANATDLDLNKNAQLLYLIAEGNLRQIFSIDNSSGTIFLARRLTTNRDTSYRLTISVQDGGQPRLHNSAFLFISVDFTNATFIDAAVELEQKYAIISGIIAGITIIIAVVVVTVILKLRTMEAGRGSEHRSKFKHASQTLTDTTQTSKVRDHELPKLQVNSKVKESGSHSAQDRQACPPFVSSVARGGGGVVGPTTYMLLSSQEMLGHHTSPHSDIFFQGRQRQHSEDIHSDSSSGDTTASDSGKGASDVEDISGGTPITSRGILEKLPIPICAADHVADGGSDSISGTILAIPCEPSGPAHLSSGPAHLSAGRTSFSKKDFDNVRRMPGKVHFSVDDQRVERSTPGISHLPTDRGAGASKHQPYSHLVRAYDGNKLPQNRQNYGLVLHKPDNHITRQGSLSDQKIRPKGSLLDQPIRLQGSDKPIRSHGSLLDQPIRLQGSLSDQPIRLDSRDQLKTSITSLNKDFLSKPGRPYISSKQQQSHDLHSFHLSPADLYHHHHDAHSISFSHSADEDDDDVSTTTSGSYAIEGIEDTISASVDC